VGTLPDSSPRFVALFRLSPHSDGFILREKIGGRQVFLVSEMDVYILSPNSMDNRINNPPPFLFRKLSSFLYRRLYFYPGLRAVGSFLSPSVPSTAFFSHLIQEKERALCTPSPGRRFSFFLPVPTPLSEYGRGCFSW